MDEIQSHLDEVKSKREKNKVQKQLLQTTRT